MYCKGEKDRMLTECQNRDLNFCGIREGIFLFGITLQCPAKTSGLTKYFNHSAVNDTQTHQNNLRLECGIVHGDKK